MRRGRDNISLFLAFVGVFLEEAYANNALATTKFSVVCGVRTVRLRLVRCILCTRRCRIVMMIQSFSLFKPGDSCRFQFVIVIVVVVVVVVVLLLFVRFIIIRRVLVFVNLVDFRRSNFVSAIAFRFPPPMESYPHLSRSHSLKSRHVSL